MCIYCGTTKHRKIYENHFGAIPKDKDGRTYEVHHVDGNHSNNDPNNLKCVTIQEHYDIHYSQGDWGACSKLLMRMETSPEVISEIKSKHARRRILDGTNPFLTLGTKMIEDGTHYFLSEEHKEQSRKRQESLVASGNHNFTVEIHCPHCNIIGHNIVMNRWHGDNCKLSPNYTPKPKRKYKKRASQHT